LGKYPGTHGRSERYIFTDVVMNGLALSWVFICLFEILEMNDKSKLKYHGAKISI